ncbi:DUF305 domain-containing protein [uncultured Sphingomonas sp.]|uniref:DUF305 domain-containing protein n=1 Tax=uncultured Sphingomonas sp. TaxID=158754 RepID=UPI0025E0E6B7|nr:DUF305 domain-containing protein [uncultured Sphingomonas sp.]
MKAFPLIFGTLVLTACGGQPAATSHQTDGAPNRHSDQMHLAPNDSEATRAYKESMTAMMANAPAFTGDADADFMQQMRVHHVAAVAMAQAELAHGKDAEARKLAQTVIDAQQQEIAQIDRWLRGKGR